MALVGKGGVGKSTIAGTLARVLARTGRPVLALDVDTMPGLAISIGLADAPDAGMPEELGTRRKGRGWVMRRRFAARTLVERYAIDAPDGVRFLQLGKLPSQVKPGSTTAFRHVVEHFREAGWSIVGDLAAGTRQGFFGWASFASVVAIVMEPTRPSVLSARRLRRLADVVPGAAIGLVINRVTDEPQARALAEEVDLPVWGAIPSDERVGAAERSGAAVIDAAADSPVVAAVERLVPALLAAQEASDRS